MIDFIALIVLASCICIFILTVIIGCHEDKLYIYLEYKKIKRHYKKLFRYDNKLIKIINFKVNNNCCLFCSRLLRNKKGALLIHYKEFIINDKYIQICEKCLKNGEDALHSTRLSYYGGRNEAYKYVKKI